MDEEDKKLEKTRRVAETTMKASKATIAKLEAEELKGTMHRAEDVAALTEDLVYTIRGRSMRCPDGWPLRWRPVSTPAEASEVIRKEVSKVMPGAGRVSLRPQEIRGACERAARLVGA